MTNFDKMFDWFRNNNTMPGPNAGRSIDPSKPGPDADRIAELEREIYTLRADLVECADTLSAQQFNQAQQKRIEACRAELAALAQSDAEPVAEEKIERALYDLIDAARSMRDTLYVHPQATLAAEWSKRIVALAQSNAEPEYYSYPDMDGITTRNVIPKQSDTSAGLIEAAEWHEAEYKRLGQVANFLYAERCYAAGQACDSLATIHDKSAKHFRARAADRSGK
jgi:hypothetical protein